MWRESEGEEIKKDVDVIYESPRKVGSDEDIRK